ncbi:SPOSA6832_01524 [Sporobolomyces salmonicolor]|uniref:SPOSA6832_01524-mRNA-1:cds n=1 Tax=Sporidiobolus salmonicolor TaxID=5005 RepID=A0A0D6EIV6_SPOSA|nr:SPOSA6832_01524 [Sporobolomyces salmonicolor]
MATPEEHPAPATADQAPSVEEPSADRSPAVTAPAALPDAAADSTPPAEATDPPVALPVAPPAAPAVSPKVAQLRALFPSTSDDILEAVLDAHGGDLGQASQTLLDMNDPEFKSSASTDNDLAQLDLDAELARQLAREDELHAQQQTRQERRQALPASTSTQREQRTPLSYQAYVPKSRRVQQQRGGEGMGSWVPPAAQQQRQGQESGEDDKDELDVLAENFSKLAEQGKKSFGSFMSKVKQQVGKLDEMIQQSASPSTSASSSDQPPAPPPKSHSLDPLCTRARSTRHCEQGPPIHLVVACSPWASRSRRGSEEGFLIGLLPRRSVSLLDDDTKLPSTSSGSSREKVRSPLSAPGDKEDKAGEDDGDDGDSDDLEYVRNPFDED